MARAIERPSEVLPTPGGPTKQRIGPLGVALELAHGEVLEDALLDLLEVVVVLVEHFARVLEVEVVGRHLLPGEAGQPVEIGADDRGLGALRVAALQAADLALQLFLRRLGHALLFGRLAVAGDLLGQLVAFAELLAGSP